MKFNQHSPFQRNQSTQTIQIKVSSSKSVFDQSRKFCRALLILSTIAILFFSIKGVFA